MASVYKASDRSIYRIKFVDQHGEPRKVASGMTDCRAAESLARKIAEDAQRLRAGLPAAYAEHTGEYLGLGMGPGRRTWAQSVQFYLDDLVRRGSPEGGRHYRDCEKQLTKIARESGWQYLSDIGAESFTAFLDSLSKGGRAPRTLNKYHQCLGAFLQWLLAPPRRWIRDNPILGLARAKGGRATRRRHRRAYTREEFADLCAAAPPWRRSVYQVAAYSGLRRIELVRLQKQDCTPVGPCPRWHLRPAVSKNGLPWTLPMLPECATVLRPIWEAAPQPDSLLFTSGQRGHPTKAAVPIPKVSTLYDDLVVAGIARVDDRGRHADFHSFRYFFCKVLGQQLPIQKVKLLMRHLTLQMTADLYGELEMEDVAEEVWELPALFSDATAASVVPLVVPLAEPSP